MLKSYSTIHDYLNDTLDFLLLQPVKNNIILGQCLNAANKNSILSETVLCSIYRQDSIVLTAFKNRERVILFGLLYHSEDLQLLSNYFKVNGFEIKGAWGDTIISIDFSKLYYPNYTIEKTLTVQQLSHLKSMELSNGSLQVCNEDDTDLLADWLYNFQRECMLPMPLTKEKTLEDARHRIEQKTLYKWVVNDEMVSICADAVMTDYFSKISLVYTPLKHRRKNYARSSVWSLTKLILDRGQTTICLFTDKSNPTSNKIYQEIGFQVIGESHEISFR